uniref:Thioredoxin domain-containing protein n=1 Tax=Calcidiscus leptoporus TaxID=127549 RepID=A0A7S0IWW6_9EUKA
MRCCVVGVEVLTPDGLCLRQCESCNLMAASMLAFEKEYGDRVDFVLLNGDDPRNAAVVRAFGVDGIPHIAMVTAQGALWATLIGFVPNAVMAKRLLGLSRAESDAGRHN